MTAGRRVLHVVSSMDDRQGGLQSAVISIANAQASGGHSVSLASSTGENDTHHGLTALDRRVAVHLFSRGRVTGRFDGSAGLRRWVRARMAGFDVVHVHSVWTIPTYLTALRAVLRRRHLIISPHGSLEPFDVRKHARAKRLLGPIFIRPVLARATTVHCTAQREARDLVTYGARVRPVVATLPISSPTPASESGTELRARYGIPAQAPLMLFLGRIDYKKGLTYLLRALALLPEPRPYLLIAGSGTAEYEKLVRDLVAALDLRREVIFSGWISGEDKAAALSGADLFVLLSDNENYGISVMEAVQAGLPVVLTEEVYIAPDLVAAGAAALSTRDPAEAAGVLGGLLADPDRLAAMRTAARSHTDAMLGSGHIASRFSELVAPPR